MPETLVDIVRPDGSRVVEKRALTPQDVVALAHEADLLTAGRHPGVVELVGLEGDSLSPVLVTTYVDGPSLDAAGSLDTEEVAGVVAGVAATLADLHELGLVHGDVAATHVIVGPHGHIVLCGFGRGGRVGEQGRQGASERCSTGGSQPVGIDPVLTTAADVHALGALIRWLVPAGSSTSHESGSSEGAKTATGGALLTIAEDATAANPDDRPTARALAAAVYGSVPGARLPRPVPRPVQRPVHPGPPASKTLAAHDGPLDDWRRQLAAPIMEEHPRWSGSDRRRRAVVTVALVGAMVTVVGAASALLPRPAARPPVGVATPMDTPPMPPSTTSGAERHPDGAPPSAPGPPSTAGRPMSPHSAESCPPVKATLQADVDGDGCVESVAFIGGVLSAGRLRWSLGAPGDQVAVGDWSCRGVRTLALLRPSTGDVFRLDAWAAEADPLTAVAVARVEHGVAVRAADLDHDGCHELVVDVRQGQPAVIPGPGQGQ